jgi:hypothetical protein
MTPRAMLATALMLGAFVTAAGAYGLFYCLARRSDSAVLKIATLASYAALLSISVAIVVLTPLHIGWKIFVVASCGAYVVIPPITWRYLTRIHRGENPSHAAGLAKHPNRTVRGLYRRA